MDTILLLIRLFLSAVFLVSGVAKLVDPVGSRKAITDFGIPAFLSVPFALLLPIAEIGAALLLIPVASAWWGAIGALALLLTFIAGISFNLAKGRRPDCHCFGQLHSKPIGAPTLIRNGILAVLAFFIIWQGGEPGASVLNTARSLASPHYVGIWIALVFWQCRSSWVG